MFGPIRIVVVAAGALLIAVGVVTARNTRGPGSSSGSIHAVRPAEFKSAAPARAAALESRAASIRKLDRNRDGFVMRSEWRGTAAAFRRLDRNDDGKIAVGPTATTGPRSRATAKKGGGVRKPAAGTPMMGM